MNLLWQEQEWINKTALVRLMRVMFNLIQEIQQVQEEVELALDMGDLRENAEYKQGKARLDFLINQHDEFQAYLNEVRIFTSQDRESIQPYSKILLLNSDLRETSLELVDRFNVNLELNKIYYKSPLGLMLLGKIKGDQVQLGRIIKVTNLIN